MSVEITPTTPADVAAFFPRASPWRIQALTVRVDGIIRGIGGFYYHSDGSRVAFIEASEADCAKYRIALAKAARRFFAELEGHGVRRLVAEGDLTRAAAPRFLRHLGFEAYARDNGRQVWLWQA